MRRAEKHRFIGWTLQGLLAALLSAAPGLHADVSDTPRISESGRNYLIGPLDSPQERDGTEAVLADAGLPFETSLQNGRESLGFIVVTPMIFRDKEEAAPLLRRLAERGIEDYLYVGRGVYRNRVSVGVFASPKAAEQRIDKLGLEGFEFVMLERFRGTDRYIVSVPVASVALGRLEQILTGKSSVADSADSADRADSADSADSADGQAKLEARIEATTDDVPSQHAAAPPGPVDTVTAPESEATPAEQLLVVPRTTTREQSETQDVGLPRPVAAPTIPTKGPDTTVSSGTWLIWLQAINVLVLGLLGYLVWRRLRDRPRNRVTTIDRDESEAVIGQRIADDVAQALAEARKQAQRSEVAARAEFETHVEEAEKKAVAKAEEKAQQKAEEIAEQRVARATDDLQARLQGEFARVRETLVTREQAALDDLRESLTADKTAALADQRKLLESQQRDEWARQREELESAHIEARKNLEAELQAAFQEQLDAAERARRMSEANANDKGLAKGLAQDLAPVREEVARAKEEAVRSRQDAEAHVLKIEELQAAFDEAEATLRVREEALVLAVRSNASLLEELDSVRRAAEQETGQSSATMQELETAQRATASVTAELDRTREDLQFEIEARKAAEQRLQELDEKLAMAKTELASQKTPVDDADAEEQPNDSERLAALQAELAATVEQLEDQRLLAENSEAYGRHQKKVLDRTHKELEDVKRTASGAKRVASHMKLRAEALEHQLEVLKKRARKALLRSSIASKGHDATSPESEAQRDLPEIVARTEPDAERPGFEGQDDAPPVNAQVETAAVEEAEAQVEEQFESQAFEPGEDEVLVAGGEHSIAEVELEPVAVEEVAEIDFQLEVLEEDNPGMLVEPLAFELEEGDEVDVVIEADETTIAEAEAEFEIVAEESSADSTEYLEVDFEEQGDAAPADSGLMLEAIVDEGANSVSPEVDTAGDGLDQSPQKDLLKPNYTGKAEFRIDDREPETEPEPETTKIKSRFTGRASFTIDDGEGQD